MLRPAQEMAEMDQSTLPIALLGASSHKSDQPISPHFTTSTTMTLRTLIPPTSSNLTTQAPASQPGLQPFIAVALYDNICDGLRAEEALTRLQRARVSDRPARMSAWSFEELTPFDSESEAFEAASRAELILIAAHAGKTLSGQIKRWLEGCFAARSADRMVLVALDGGINERLVTWREAWALRSSLRQFAELWGAGFLNHEEFVWRLASSASVGPPWNPQKLQRASTATGALRPARAPRRFGIND